MRRNPNLIRRILEYVEANDQQGFDIPNPQFLDIDDAVTMNHVRLCYDAGFITGIDPRTGTGEIIIQQLTWAGHEELARLRGQEARMRITD